VEVEYAVVRAPASFALNALADRPDDLLVLGAGPHRPLLRTLRGHVRRRTVTRAAAPVLLVSHPKFPHRMRRELRRVTPDDFLGRRPKFEC
jgi:nucleotide-binding universal stress UspA family protein